MRQLILLLPGMVCLFWLVLYWIMSSKERVYKYAIGVLAIQAVYYFSAVMPLVVADISKTVVLCTLLEQAFGLVSIPLALSYLFSMQERFNGGRLLRMCYFLPVILVVAECVVIWIIGFSNATRFLMDINSGKLTGFSITDRSQELLYFCVVIGFKVFISMEFLFFVILSLVHVTGNHFRFGKMFGFLFKGKKAEVVCAQNSLMLVMLTFNLLLLVLGKSFSMNRQWLLYFMCLCISLMLTLAALMGTVGNNLNCSFRDIMDRLKFNRPVTAPVTDKPDEKVLEHADSVTKSSLLDLKPVTSSSDLGKTLDLSARFENLMLQERMFLERNITIADVAQKLGIEKEALADLLNDVYGITFPAYLNMLRIDYAEQFILNNEKVTQKYIAQACGFSSAASFNVAFTKYAGVTPKIWKDRYLEMSQR